MIARRRSAGCPSGHDNQDQQRHGRRKRGQNGKQAAPADALDHDLGRARCGQGAEGTQHDVPAVGERDALGREPQDDGLEAGHQGDSDTEADQRAAEHQGNHAVGKREHERPETAISSSALWMRRGP